MKTKISEFYEVSHMTITIDNSDYSQQNEIVEQLESDALKGLYAKFSIDINNKYFARFSSYDVFVSFLNLSVFWVFILVASLILAILPNNMEFYNNYSDTVVSQPETNNNWSVIFLLLLLLLFCVSIIYKFLRITFLEHFAFFHRLIDWKNQVLDKLFAPLVPSIRKVRNLIKGHVFLGDTIIGGWLFFSIWLVARIVHQVFPSNLFTLIWVNIPFGYQFAFNFFVTFPLSITLFLSCLRLYGIYQRLTIKTDSIDTSLITRCQEELGKNANLHLLINNRRENFANQFSHITSFANILSAAIATITIVGFANLFVDFLETYFAIPFNFIYLVPLTGLSLVWLENISEHVIKLRSLNILMGASQIALEMQKQKESMQSRPNKRERFIDKLGSWFK